jgi:hypothetical protein
MQAPNHENSQDKEDENKQRDLTGGEVFQHSARPCNGATSSALDAVVDFEMARLNG